MPVVALTGCAGADLAGTYRADVRLIEGRQESTDPGYSLAEVRARLQKEPSTLTLQSNGRYRWQNGNFVNEGNWRVEGDALILRDDISNGVRVQPALQKDRRWRIGESGEIVNEGSYGYYNLEEVYVRE
jgi:hypothetical protein